MSIKKSVTVSEMHLFEDWAINFIGVPAIILMENAGRSVAEYIYQNYFYKKKTYSQVNIFCGTGNNGGDGLVAARHLYIKGVNIKVYIVGGISALSPDSELNFRILRKMGILVSPILSEKDILKIQFGKKDIVVDALFGLGLNRDINGAQRDIIDLINSKKVPVISIDVPSGLNANTGEDWGICIKATVTITYVYPRRGFYIRKGRDMTGKIVVADNIGISKKRNKKRSLVFSR